ncbi:MAG: efflux RND transporter permease subunit [Bacteroidales bacterium]|nr:efflux RND transporter permease subunit [Bacteroidales bacterium]
MVKFLLRRPIAVIMAFLAFIIIGVVTYTTLPVSLLPAIAIPHITVQITGENTGARELENNVTAPVRRQLLQVTGLNDMRSETRDGVGIIHLEFDYGVNTDLAFIEVNEKIDAAMNSLPKDATRPKAIKASATDIPVLYLNMTLRDDKPFGPTDETAFLEMCDLAENVVRRRIEQLPEIAMADITGIPGKYLRIEPDPNKMVLAGVSVSDLEAALTANNVEPGSMRVHNGYYEYDIHISNSLRTPEDVENIYLTKGDKLMQLGDFCKVSIVAQNANGYSYSNGKRAITMAIIKQSEENMDKMKAELSKATDYFASLYPNIEFTQSRNQTELLDYTIDNLVQNLVLGFILVILVTALFMGEVRSSVIIGCTILTAIIITFLVFYLFHVSLNIISLSGLILAVGMMIDNSVIVTENITQWRQRGYTLMRACDVGTTEMITPLLSSSLTTIAVFVPLIFMSGIAGAIFTDQAFSITAGLAVSYIVGIMLLPVIYMLVYRVGGRKGHRARIRAFHESKLTHRIDDWMDKVYDGGINWTFSHKALCLTLVALILPLCWVMFKVMRVERMPEIDQVETILKVEWNENVNIDENYQRVSHLLQQTDSSVVYHSVYVGVQDYLLDAGSELSPSEAEIYLKTETPDQIAPLQERLQAALAKDYPRANYTFAPPENVFEKIFASSEADLEARLYPADKSHDPGVESLLAMEQTLYHTSHVTTPPIPLRDRITLIVDRQKLLLYRVDYSEVERALKTAFKSNTVSTLRSYQQYLPIGIASTEKKIEDVLTTTLVATRADKEGKVSEIPLSRLVTMARSQDLKSISAGKNGTFVPLAYNGVDKAEPLVSDIQRGVDTDKDWEVEFSGAIFSNAQMMRELVVILLLSVLLMYFILCAQFESFLQPLIVLLEIPLDTAFALVTLWLCGHTLNLMSAIGIIVTCGIVVNDSILKIDAINELRAQGMHIDEAIHTAGRRRLRPIIMTSLTTILAMVPMLFTNDMGSELQRPLAIAMIGSMVVGTVISVFIIPLVYRMTYIRSDK